MKIPLYQIDAFTGRVFGGSPAAVCLLEEWLDEKVLQSVALENNLPATAFLIDRGEHFDLRWFTPTAEIELCGHATLASAHVLFEEIDIGGDTVHFETRHSGRLTVRRGGGRLTMDFPAKPPRPVENSGALALALGGAPVEALACVNYLAVFASEADVRALEPDGSLIAALDYYGVIATAPGDSVDFVSRFFRPKAGDVEDPVTGSAHCESMPYWAKRLGKSKLTAHQVSARGGELFCEHRGERVLISGRAVKYMEGIIVV